MTISFLIQSISVILHARYFFNFFGSGAKFDIEEEREIERGSGRDRYRD